MAAEVAGRVTEIVRDEGLEVAQGEVVASIDPERRRLEVAEARAGVVQADAQAAEAAREHTRIRTLHEKGVASQARLEQLETQLRLARLSCYQRVMGGKSSSAEVATIAATL